jgi:hypothetical protein
MVDPNPSCLEEEWLKRKSRFLVGSGGAMGSDLYLSPLIFLTRLRDIFKGVPELNTSCPTADSKCIQEDSIV